MGESPIFGLPLVVNLKVPNERLLFPKCQGKIKRKTGIYLFRFLLDSHFHYGTIKDIGETLCSVTNH